MLLLLNDLLGIFLVVQRVNERDHIGPVQCIEKILNRSGLNKKIDVEKIYQRSI